AAAAAAQQREAERQRAEEEQRRAAAAERERAEEERRQEERRQEEERLAAADPPDDAEDDDFDFSFGGGVTIDEEAEEVAPTAVAYEDAARSGAQDARAAVEDRVRRSTRGDMEELEDRARRFAGDSDIRARLDARPSTADMKASIAVRAGYSRFQDLNFVTYGAEASFMATTNLAIVAGAEAYSTLRIVPEEQLDEGQLPQQWNTILPLNAGLQYKFGSSSVRPYIGGGMQVIPGVVKDSGGVALGLRARGGADFAITDVFGFNVNVAAGIWSGQQFQQIEDGFGAAAVVPQLSAGTIFLF
ncbi:MAG: hypothetical protein VX000_14935, partial [Myxococcota bacterium]|nr:hypothetical protein [Myxococcota bacterium]